VTVSVGDEVEAGDVLVRLDAQDLRAAVTRAKADLADAEAYLDDVRDGQIDTVTRAMGAGASGASSTGTGAVTTALYTGTATTTFASSSSLEQSLAELKAQQDAVTSAQSEATAALAAAKDALAAQRDACEDDQVDPDATGLPQACTDALAAVQDAQDVVAERQDALKSALDALGTTLTKAVTQLGEQQEDGTTPSEKPSEGTDRPQQEKPQGTPKTAPQSGAKKGGAPASAAPGAGSGSGTGSGTAATASDLAAAQADVDTAEAALASARADLEAATITAPFDGTVAAVDVAKGDQVAAADRALVLIGHGDTTATLSVPVDELGQVEVDQAATVTTASGTPAAGRVSAIGLAPEASDDRSSSTTYRVTVRLDGDVAAPEGSAASVALVTGTASDVVTVPASAVTRRTATAGTVQVLADGEVERRQVTLGPVGATTIAVTEGLEAGDRVVLADLETALPSGGTSDLRSVTGGGRGGPSVGQGGGPDGPPSRSS